ncbi:MAG: DUF808 domain-containing protein [bacterium]|nr:DUF808 domain-containing protein [bacterium]
MAGGLAALLDDVAVIAKMASAAGTKAVGVIIDDAAVTPRYVTGFHPSRELPMIWKIAKGSFINKAIVIAALMALSEFAPWILTPLLMLGGAYLVYEGAEKVWEFFRGKPDGHAQGGKPVSEQGPEQEAKMVRGAITTDFVLSAEIMMISLNEIGEATFWQRLITLIVVGIGITVLVYGVVALIVKMDDIGLQMAKGEREGSQKFGRFLVNAMPHVLTTLQVVGVVAMLWVGGHILLNGTSELGWTAPYNLLHTITDPVAEAAGGFAAWVVDTLLSAVIGFLVGSVLVGILHFTPLGHKDHAEPAEETAAH